MNIPKVSFVLPAYKREYLDKAIQSILSQTYQNYELIIVNDASPQDIDSVVCQFSDCRISYYVNEKNLGGRNLTESWNHALQYAKGEYIVLASDDDVYHPDYLDKIMALVEKYPMVDLFHCRLCYINGAGDFQFSSQPALEYESCEYFVFQRLFYDRKQAAPEFLFRKSAMEKLGGFISFPLAWYSDDATWTALSSNGICCTQDALLDFRMSGLNLSTASVGNELKIEALYQYREWLINFLSQRNPSNKEDRIILDRCRNSVVSILNAHIFMYLPYVPFRNYVKTLCTAVDRRFITPVTSLSLFVRRILGK